MSDTQKAPECPVREGDVLAGKYRVEKVLGVGGMGVVVAAMHVELDEKVALKFLLPSAMANPAVVARFAREAKAAVKIKSQHVATVRDVGTLENGTPYIVMEYLQGSDLSDLLTRAGRLSVGDAIDHVLQAGEAIAEAHAAGIVHRDLKPANLFLAEQSDGTSIIKVLDFGISKAALADDGPQAVKAGALTRTTDIFGSPLYMSPEQLKSSRDVDARADIWALGVILYELISGKAPFDRPTVAETFGAILYEKPPPLHAQMPEIPEELDRVILRCMEKDANLRLPNVAELSRALFPFAGRASQASLERTSRVLRRAGVTIKSVPPAAELPAPRVQAQTNAGAPPSLGAQTRTAWDTASQVPRPRPRPGPRVALLAAGMLVLGGGVVALKRFLRPPTVDPSVRVQADQPGTTPASSATVVPVGTQTTPSAVPATPTATAVPSVTPGATIPPRGKGAHGPKSGPHATAAPARTAAPATAAVVTPPPPPAKAPQDDGFGDRK